VTREERKDPRKLKFANAVGRRDTDITMTLIHLQTLKPIIEKFHIWKDSPATRSCITAELVTRESRSSSKRNIDDSPTVSSEQLIPPRMPVRRAFVLSKFLAVEIWSKP
jgi:hypothetical protein